MCSLLMALLLIWVHILVLTKCLHWRRNRTSLEFSFKFNTYLLEKSVKYESNLIRFFSLHDRDLSGFLIYERNLERTCVVRVGERTQPGCLYSRLTLRYNIHLHCLNIYVLNLCQFLTLFTQEFC